MSTRGLVLLFGALALFALVQIYAMFFVFACMTGWRRLARTYPLRAGGRVPRLSKTSGVLLAAWGWNAPPMRLGYDDGAFFLRPLAIFRPAFGTLAIPWSEVTTVERKDVFDGHVLVMTFGRLGRETMAFFPSVLDERLVRLAEGGNIRESSPGLREDYPRR